MVDVPAGLQLELAKRFRPILRFDSAVQARFCGLGLETGQEAQIRIRYRKAKVRVALTLPSGQVREPPLETIAGSSARFEPVTSAEADCTRR